MYDQQLSDANQEIYRLKAELANAVIKDGMDWERMKTENEELKAELAVAREALRVISDLTACPMLIKEIAKEALGDKP